MKFEPDRTYTLAEIERETGNRATFNTRSQSYSVVDVNGDFSQYDFDGEPDNLRLELIDGVAANATPPPQEGIMYVYRVRLKKVNHRQVDIVSDNPLTVAEIHRLAIEQGNREFGESDETEVVQAETVSEPPDTGGST